MEEGAEFAYSDYKWQPPIAYLVLETEYGSGSSNILTT